MSFNGFLFGIGVNKTCAVSQLFGFPQGKAKLGISSALSASETSSFVTDFGERVFIFKFY